MQGWVSSGGEDRPAPTGIFTMSGSLPIRLAMVLVPYNVGASSGFTMQALDASDGVWLCEITRRDGTIDRVAHRWEGTAPLKVADTEADADVLIVQQLPDGATRAAEFRITNR